MRARSFPQCIALPVLLSGCLTFAGGQLDDVPVTPAAPETVIEQAVGDFAFERDGGKLTTSRREGENFNDAILNRWVEADLISAHRSSESSDPTDASAMRLTLSGRQIATSNPELDALSGLTVLAIPTYTDMTIHATFSLENAETGCVFEAASTDSYTVVISLFLVPVLPFWKVGTNRTFDRMADHLYSELASKGAFEAGEPCDPAPGLQSAEARLKDLDRRLEAGQISPAEHDARRKESYFTSAASADPACSLTLVRTDAQSEARFEFVASKIGMLPGVLRCASEEAAIRLQSVEICATGTFYPGFSIEDALERARTPTGLPFGVAGGLHAGLIEQRNRDIEAQFRANQYQPALLEPEEIAKGSVYFDVPIGTLPEATGAKIAVLDIHSGDTREVHVGDTTSCSVDAP